MPAAGQEFRLRAEVFPGKPCSAGADDLVLFGEEEAHRAGRSCAILSHGPHEPQQFQIGMRAGQVLCRMRRGDAVGLAGCPDIDIIVIPPRAGSQKVVSEMPRRGPDVKGAAQQHHPREGARALPFGFQPQQTAHGMPDEDQPVTLAAQFPGSLPDRRKPLFAPGSAESLHIRAVTGQQEIADADILRQALGQEDELGRAALDAVDEK